MAPLIPNPAGNLLRRVDHTLERVDGVVTQVDTTLTEVGGTLTSVDGKLGTVDATLANVDGTLVKVEGSPCEFFATIPTTWARYAPYPCISRPHRCEERRGGRALPSWLPLARGGAAERAGFAPQRQEAAPGGGLCDEEPAASYSPRPLRAKYHRR
jgi:hypothetical protein